MVPILALACFALAPQLQPATFTSPSGAWALRVDPRDRDGTGAAEYALSRDGKAAWRKEHPFVLYETAVTEDGRVAGYAYVGEPAQGPVGGDLRVVLLSPTGELVLQEVHARHWTGLQHAPPAPLARGLFAQPELGRFVVRVLDVDDQQLVESWWTFDLVSGALLFRRRPELEKTRENSLVRLIIAHAVPGTPLVLVNWFRCESEPTWTCGAVFQLLDAEGRSVWRLDLPGNYEIPGDERGRNRLQAEIYDEGTILATAPGRFELRRVADKERVAYEVVRESEDTWRVTEVARSPYVAPSLPARALDETLRPELRAEIALTSLPSRPIRDVLAFDFDADGNLRFARREEDGCSLVVLSDAGVVERVTHVPAERVGQTKLVRWFPLASPRWLAVAGGTRRAWLVDEERGEAREVESFTGEDVRRAVPLDDERFVALSTSEDRSSLRVVCCDDEGHASWELKSLQPDAPLFSPADVTVTRAGEVVVLDNIRNTLQVFSSSGALLRTVELTEAWSKKPNYPSSVVSDVEGGVLVHDFEGEPPLWRMTADGRVRAALDARMADGTPREGYRRGVRVAPDGRLWTTDGHELLRLDEEGRVDRVLGAPGPVADLVTITTASIDSTFGRVLVLDGHTNALHALDAMGRRVTLGLPRSEDLVELSFPLRMRCLPDGGLLAGECATRDNYVFFAADGASRGVEAVGGTDIAFMPDRDAYWCVAEDRPVRFARAGQREVQLPRTPEGRWWRYIADLAVAADGRLAVLELSEGGPARAPAWFHTKAEGEGQVALYDRDGLPLARHALPETIRPMWIACAGPWVVLDGSEGWLLDTRNGSLRRIDIGSWEADWTSWGLAPSGDELWAVQPRLRRFLRFALPP